MTAEFLKEWSPKLKDKIFSLVKDLPDKEFKAVPFKEIENAIGMLQFFVIICWDKRGNDKTSRGERWTAVLRLFTFHHVKFYHFFNL